LTAIQLQVMPRPAKIRTREELQAAARKAHPLSWFRPGRRVRFHDRMQRGSYVLTARPGRDFAPGFRPQLSPGRILRMGAFEGKYLNDCTRELPREWFTAALPRLSPAAPCPALNAFGVKSRLSLGEWRARGWIRRGDPDVRGWFQWFCRYWLGRRGPEDARQVARWRSFARHAAQVRASYRRGRRPVGRAAMRLPRPRQRQALLQWAYNPWI